MDRYLIKGVIKNNHNDLIEKVRVFGYFIDKNGTTIGYGNNTVYEIKGGYTKDFNIIFEDRNYLEYIKGVNGNGKLNLDHVVKYNKEIDALKLKEERVAPMLLPDYSNPDVRERQLTSKYLGTIR